MLRFSLVAPFLFSVLRGAARRVFLLIGGLALAASPSAFAQPTITGAVIVGDTGKPVPGAEVRLVETGQVAETDEDGRFLFELEEHVAAVTFRVDVGFLSAVGSVALADDGQETTFQLPEALVLEHGLRTHEHVTVTASATEASPFEAFGTVSGFEGLDLQNEPAHTLGELLDGTPGVAMRSFGPGAARPVIRGFDGDRVLVMEDGVRTGDLGSQSTDHGVPVDPLQAERVEIVRGPATLLYGANAIGGAVNVISMASHMYDSPTSGFRGQANVDYSTADEGRRGGARVEASGGGWFAWGGGNSSRRNDYNTPIGRVENSGTSMDQGEVGFGILGDRAWFSGSVRLDDSRYGVPFAGEFHGGGHGEEEELHGDEEEEEGEEEHGDELMVDIGMNRRQFRTDFGIRDLDTFFDSADITVRYTDYYHGELETEPDGDEFVATRFDNETLVVRGELQKPSGRLQSRAGVWVHLRQFEVAGEEALAPPTDQDSFAAFTYNEIEVSDRFDLLLGARAERNSYSTGERPESAAHGEAHGPEEEEEEEEHPEEEEEAEDDGEEEEEAPEAVDREFSGVSASAGARFELGDSTALVGVASLSTRTPALEELYFYGAHFGTRAFDVGNPHLEPERSLGLDLTLRQNSDQFSGSLNFFRYDIRDFIFGAARGEIREGLPVLDFLQADTTYQGFEVEGHLMLGSAELEANASYVDAQLTGTNEYAPRIPPFGGQVKLDIPVGRFRLSPRLRWAAKMDRLYQGETATDSYAVLDFTASRVFVRTHSTSNISLRAYNITDTEYRHHTSLIKDLAPQMGRGFRISYSVRFF